MYYSYVTFLLVVDPIRKKKECPQWLSTDFIDLFRSNLGVSALLISVSGL